ncbi:carbonic anhydrase [Pendulispora albinea]|uniref:Carbonic anhydrase n=1 Tax=Pendulispora albinea TaxID=2741071 RepID=A0ABZ2M1Q3_9BACT
MQKLIQGIHEFQRSIFRPQRELFEKLASGQSPDTLFITCSDSRINPNLITQTAPGELFIIRNAGNIIPPHSPHVGGEAATIEYAVAVLKVKDIIICGHTHCGAMKAVVDPKGLEELPRVAAWLAHTEATRQIIREHYQHLEGHARITATVQENVLVQLEHLRTHPLVASRLAGGTLRLHGWVYKIETGEVFAFDPEQRQFVPVTEARLPAPPTPVSHFQSI